MITLYLEKNSAGSSRVRELFDELSRYLEEWQKFQSDACYCNERGEVE